MPDPFAGQPDWAPRPPRTIVPVAAVGSAGPARAAGHRGLPRPGLARRPARRRKGGAGQPHLRAAIPEQEWYRAEAEQIEVFAPLVPAERVWVETFGEPRGHGRGAAT